jgi:hypothetical protein
LVFDRHTLRCIAPPTEDCEAPSTAAPFLDEDDDDLPPRRGQQNLEDEEENLPPPRPQQAKNNNNAPVPLQQRPNNNNNRPRNWKVERTGLIPTMLIVDVKFDYNNLNTALYFANIESFFKEICKNALLFIYVKNVPYAIKSKNENDTTGS